jgi:hypothetical protein
MTMTTALLDVATGSPMTRARSPERPLVPAVSAGALLAASHAARINPGVAPTEISPRN